MGTEMRGAIHVTARCCECAETLRIDHFYLTAEASAYAGGAAEFRAITRANVVAKMLDDWLDHSDTHASRSVLLTIKETP